MKKLAYLIFAVLLLSACANHAFLKQRYTRYGHSPIAKHIPKDKPNAKSHDADEVKLSTIEYETKRTEESLLIVEPITGEATVDIIARKNKSNRNRFTQRLDKLGAIHPEIKEEIEKLIIEKQKKGVVFENITYYAYGLLVLALLVASLLIVFDVWDVGI